MIATQAYWQQSHDTQWVVQYYDILKQWTQFLVEDGLIPDTQLSTDDFAGPFPLDPLPLSD
jgi:hypothetical protein